MFDRDGLRVTPELGYVLVAVDEGLDYTVAISDAGGLNYSTVFRNAARLQENGYLEPRWEKEEVPARKRGRTYRMLVDKCYLKISEPAGKALLTVVEHQFPGLRERVRSAKLRYEAEHAPHTPETEGVTG